MLRRLRSYVTRLLGRDPGHGGDTGRHELDADDENGDDESGGFAFSLLDASVQYAHGVDQGTQGVKAVQRASERAEELQDADDRRR